MSSSSDSSLISTFELFITTFNKHYDSLEERNSRFEIFKTKYMEILMENSKGAITYIVLSFIYRI